MDGRPSLVFFERRPTARIRLFCLAHAGGSAAVYASWCSKLPQSVELCGLELPGRGRRWGEPLARDLQSLVLQLQRDVVTELDRPHAFFGHSMGALIAFELIRSLRRAGHAMPVALFASGRGAPHARPRLPFVSSLSDSAFVDAMRRYNGSPADVFATPELRELFLPILRADVTLNEHYEHYPEEPLACPIHSMQGVDDEMVDSAAAADWSTATSAPFFAVCFAGDHFYLRSSESEVVAYVSRELERSQGLGP